MKKRQCGIMLATQQKSHTFFTHFGWSQLATRLSPEFRSTCILVLGQKTTTKIFLFFQPQFYHTFSGSFLEHPFFRNCCLFCLNTIKDDAKDLMSKLYANLEIFSLNQPKIDQNLWMIQKIFEKNFFGLNASKWFNSKSYHVKIEI